MPFLDKNIRNELEKQFEQLHDYVNIINFTQEIECRFCTETRELLEETVSLSSMLRLEIHIYLTDKRDTDRFLIDKIPATAIMADKDYGIRFYGVPAGYVFRSLIETVVMVSKKESGLSERSREVLTGLTKPLHIQVFVSPTCPDSAKSALQACQFAIESDNVRTDVISITEFPHLAVKHGVRGVPKTVANERLAAEGAISEGPFLRSIMSALK